MRGEHSGGGRGRRRDRHGRGLRGPLTPGGLPISRTRAQRFDDFVLEAVGRLERQWGTELAGVEFAVEDVPPVDAWTLPDDPIPLGNLYLAEGGLPTRIVVYRRPAEIRARDGEDLGALVHDVVVEEVAELLGLEPETVDPDYDVFDDGDE
ncbi:MAG: peptidase [Streptosporangiales bacterium]|nr:peptidase [Streptosporangiales bacterium]